MPQEAVADGYGDEQQSDQAGFQIEGQGGETPEAVGEDHEQASGQHDADDAGLKAAQNGLHIFVFQCSLQQDGNQQN